METARTFMATIIHPKNITDICEHLVCIQGPSDCLSRSALSNFLPNPNLNFTDLRPHAASNYTFLLMGCESDANWLSKKKKLKYNEKVIRMRRVMHPDYNRGLLDNFFQTHGREHSQIFLKDLPPKYSHELLFKYFSQFGPIRELIVVPRKDKHKNIGYLTFETLRSTKTTLMIRHSIVPDDSEVVIPLLLKANDELIKREAHLFQKPTSSFIEHRSLSVYPSVRNPIKRYFISEGCGVPQDIENVRFNMPCAPRYKRKASERDTIQSPTLLKPGYPSVKSLRKPEAQAKSILRPNVSTEQESGLHLKSKPGLRIREDSRE